MFNRRFGVALIVGAVTFSIIYGVAASLSVSGNTLGSGTSSVTSCDSDGVSTSYASAYDASVAGYEVTTVSVAGIASTCGSKSLKVTLIGAADASLAEQTVTLAATPADPTTLSFTSSNVLASSVVKVAVVISG